MITVLLRVEAAVWQWFWDVAQCRHTARVRGGGLVFDVYCQRVRWHPGKHEYPA